MQMFTKSLTDVFGIPGAEGIQVDVFETNALAPILHSRDHQFDKAQLKLVLAFLTTANAGDGMLIHGPFGAGKTSLLRQILGRLNWPTLMLSWNEASDTADLIGRTGISFGDTAFEYGPLARAMKEGFALVVNEVDRGRAGNLVALNDMLDGGNLLIKETGEVIEPHPNFRLFCTANSAGSGDSSGAYTGSVRRLDPAFLDRFVFLKVGYMTEEQELDLMLRRYPSFDGPFLQRMAAFAAKTRASVEDPVEPLTVAFSTRSFDRFLRLARCFGIDKTPAANQTLDIIRPALAPAYLDRLSPVEREAAETLINMSL